MPTTTSTDRETFKTDLYNLLVTFAAAHPSNVVRAFRARPVSSPDTPFVFIDAIRHRSHHDMSTRTTTFDGLEFVLVEQPTDNAEVALRLDQTVDLLLDFLTDNPQLNNTRGVWSDVICTDESYDLGDYNAPAVRFAFPDISVQVGRR